MFFPEISLQTQTLIRFLYGVLMAGTLLHFLPQWRRFFICERWRGYAQSSIDAELLQNPFLAPFIWLLWFSCSLFIAVGYHSVVSALVNLLFCRYFFIYMRWKSILRGAGAPGFISYWLGAAVFLLELTLHCSPSSRPLALFAVQIDFAVIISLAGVYKLCAGYLKNHGMEYGMVNPEWGYWHSIFSKLPTNSILFYTFNQLAWSMEILAGILMLIPELRFWGGLLLIASFIFIRVQIRLGLLCEMVMVIGLLYFEAASLGDQWIASLLANFQFTNSPQRIDSKLFDTVIQSFLWIYLLLLPFAYGGLCYNFYARKSLPNFWQKVLERYTNFFGMILWRVFSVDVTNFYVLIFRQNRDDSNRVLVTRFGWLHGLRYAHVCESITLTCLMTCLKYYSSNQKIFYERIMRYSKTLDCAENEILVFQYVSILKENNRFHFEPQTEFWVDPNKETVDEKPLKDASMLRSAHKASPVQEGVRPGSYAPLKGQ